MFAAGDSTRLAATTYNDNIYTSSDSGVNWTGQTASGARSWSAISMTNNAAGIAAISGTVLYISSDAGATWMQNDLGSRCNASGCAMAVSSDFAKLVVAATGKPIYISVDSGATWTARTVIDSGAWRTLATNSDGTKLVGATEYSARVYTSADAGVSWTVQSSAGQRNWTGVASSSDGTRLAASVSSGYIYTSADSGATWVERTAAGSRIWTALASSADGSRIIAGTGDGYLYTSRDAGVSWKTESTPAERYWSAVVSNSDGTRVVGSVSGGRLYLAGIEGAATTTVDISTVAPATTVNQAISKATLSVTSSTCYTIDSNSITLLDNTGVQSPSANVSIVGGLSFNLNCVADGGSAPLTLTLGSSYQDVSKLRAYKKDSTGTLRDITGQILIKNTTVNGVFSTTLDYTLVDGGIYDEDGVANGVIVDPIYIGVVAEPLASTGINVAALFGYTLTAAFIGLSIFVLTKKRSTLRQ